MKDPTKGAVLCCAVLCCTCALWEEIQLCLNLTESRGCIVSCDKNMQRLILMMPKAQQRPEAHDLFLYASSQCLDDSRV